MSESIDVAVIGAGVVGLAVARQLAIEGHDVVIIESEDVIGSGVSSRNSEVIHAGIYYPPASKKARFCVRGRDLLYDYCASRHVEHRRLGKLLVASGLDAKQRLEAIKANAIASGVSDLRLLSREEVLGLEAEVRADAGLFSPSSGIIDSHGLMTALLADAEAHGAVLALKSKVVSACLKDGKTVLEVDANASSSIDCEHVVNCAGLGAIGVAQCMAGFPAPLIPKAQLAKGNYFSLGARAPFSHLIYPLPEAGGLGIHVTLDLAGQVKFGPDVEWVERIDYRVDAGREDAFKAAIRSYWPNLPDGALCPAYAGIRPKIEAGATAADFCILGPRQHGIAGLVQLFGIESPGLTACLAIAEHVALLLDDRPDAEVKRR